MLMLFWELPGVQATARFLKRLIPANSTPVQKAGDKALALPHLCVPRCQGLSGAGDTKGTKIPLKPTTLQGGGWLCKELSTLHPSIQDASTIQLIGIIRE